MDEIVTTTQRQKERAEKIGKVSRVIYKSLTVLVVIVMVVYCLTMMYPIIWMLLTSVKDGDFEYTGNMLGLPQSFRIQNYADVWDKLYIDKVRADGAVVRYYVPEMLGFSVFYCVFAAVWGELMQVNTAYAMSKYKFVGNKFFYTAGIVMMLTPIMGTTTAALRLGRLLGVYDNVVMYVLTAPCTCFSGFSFLLLYNTFKGIPDEFGDSVEIDGGGHLAKYFYVYLPMIFPTAMVQMVLGFLASWNNYSAFLFWLPSYPYLALAMYNIQQKASLWGMSMPDIMAGFAIVCIPSAIVYFASQKSIMSKLRVGGLKG